MNRKCCDTSTREAKFLLSMRKLHRAMMMQMKQTALKNELSMPQFAILNLMEHDGKIAQKKIQELTHFPKSTISHAIEGLVQTELVIRTQVEGNRREMDVRLTKEGEQLLNEIRAQHNEVNVKIKAAVDSFTEEQFENLMEMHHHITNYFEEGDGE